MNLMKKILLFIKGSTCYNCRHYNVCEFANTAKKYDNPNTFCSNKKENVCKNKKIDNAKRE